MTHKEAIKELKILKDDYWDDDGYGHETKQYNDTILALDMAIQVLEQTEWIPVSERLPKVNQYVDDVCKYYLVQDRYGDMHVAHYQEHGWESIESRLFIDVVAWMPLPSPFEPQEISDHNLKMWEEIYAEEKRRERSEDEADN